MPLLAEAAMRASGYLLIFACEAWLHFDPGLFCGCGAIDSWCGRFVGEGVLIIDGM